MKITNEKLYEMIVEMKEAQSAFHANISKWGVALFIGSIVAMTSIIGVFLASIVLVVAK